jgi:hypothetical protein
MPGSRVRVPPLLPKKKPLGALTLSGFFCPAPCVALNGGRGLGQVPLPAHEIPEIHPTFRIQRYHLAIRDDLPPAELHPDPLAEFRKAAEAVPPLGVHSEPLVRQVKDPSEPIVLGLEQPGRVVKRVWPERRDDRLHRGRATVVLGIVAVESNSPEGTAGC